MREKEREREAERKEAWRMNMLPPHRFNKTRMEKEDGKQN